MALSVSHPPQRNKGLRNKSSFIVGGKKLFTENTVGGRLSLKFLVNAVAAEPRCQRRQLHKAVHAVENAHVRASNFL